MNLYLEVSEDKRRQGTVPCLRLIVRLFRLRRAPSYTSAICSVGFAFGGAGAALPVHPSDKTVRSYVCR